MESYEIFISGYAKLPGGTTSEALYKVVAVGLLVDRRNGLVLDADFTLATSVAKQFMKELMIGQSLLDPESIERKIEERYFGSAKKAILTSIRRCCEKYKLILEQGTTE